MEKKELAVERNIPKEINESYREDLKLMRQNKEHRTKRHTMFNDGPTGVSKKVRHLEPDEIKEEYGMESCPYPTMAENIIAVLMEEKREFLTLNQIAARLGKTAKNISPHVSGVYLAFHSVNEELIERRMHTTADRKNQYEYRLLVDDYMGIVILKEMYLKGMTIRRDAETARKKDKALTKEMEKMEETAEDMDLVVGKKGADLLQALIKSGLDIRVTVKIEILR